MKTVNNLTTEHDLDLEDVTRTNNTDLEKNGNGPTRRNAGERANGG